MLVSHQREGTWLFYVIAPIMLCGVVACLWWIVKGAIGTFGRTPTGRTSVQDSLHDRVIFSDCGGETELLETSKRTDIVSPSTAAQRRN